MPATPFLAVCFPNMKHSYEIAETEILEPTAIEELLSDEWNLTLFTCTYGGQARVAVRCRAIGLK